MNTSNREFKTMADLSHPSIPEVFEIKWNEINQTTYLILEYFEGETLDNYIENYGIFNWEDSVKVIKQLVEVVNYLHNLGIAHRDIKPQNILINDSHELKLIDFNISK